MHRPTASQIKALAQIDEAATLRTLNRFAVDLITIPSAEELYWYVAQNVVGQLNFVDCVIYQANTAQSELRQVAAWGDKNPFGRDILNPLVIPFGTGITGTVAQTRKPMIVADLRKTQDYILDTQMARSEICVPLIFRDRVVGVIDSEHPQPNAFDGSALEVLTTVAAMTAAKLELLAEQEQSEKRYLELRSSHAQLTEEIATRKALESRLLEARKMESIGRLTGRFAHEFNNLLTVILGNLELLESEVKQTSAPGFLSEARKAGTRAAKMVKDMLVFAQRTRLTPEPVALNSWIEAFCQRHQTKLEVPPVLELAEPLWLITADTNTLDAMLLNLMENARLAQQPGHHVLIKTGTMIHNPEESPIPGC